MAMDFGIVKKGLRLFAGSLVFLVVNLGKWITVIVRMLSELANVDLENLSALVQEAVTTTTNLFQVVTLVKV